MKHNPGEPVSGAQWKTKPSDRFILKWIKVNLSARITPKLVALEWLRPWMLTSCSAALGVLAGAVFAAGSGWIAGILAAFAQVLDGVDGQFARLTDRQSKGGAFLDSVLDRYFDAALMIGLVVYLVRLPVNLPSWLLLGLARAESLGIPMGKPTLASKGTRTSITALSGLASFFWPSAPLAALIYLAIHPNVAVLRRIFLSRGHSDPP